jgi:cation diffusion facilitator family transporter
LKEHYKSILRVTLLSIVINAVLALVKGITGVLGNSYALIADAIESVSDIFSSLIVVLGIKISSRPADENHPYGHGRAETLAAFVVVGLLLAAAVFIAIESIHNIRTPHPLPSSFTLIVLAVVIVIKELLSRKVNKTGTQTFSTSLKADAWHHRSDALTSGAAFIGISVALIGGKGWEAADDWAALFGSVIISINSFFILRPALGEIMDEHSYDGIIKQVRDIASHVPGVIDTEKCMVRKMGVNFYIDLHITVSGNLLVKEGHDIAHALKNKITNAMPHVADVLIHVEPDIF